MNGNPFSRYGLRRLFAAVRVRWHRFLFFLHRYHLCRGVLVARAALCTDNQHFIIVQYDLATNALPRAQNYHFGVRRQAPEYDSKRTYKYV